MRSVPLPRRRLLGLAVVAVGGIYLAGRLGLLWRFPPFWDEAYYATWTLEVFRAPQHPLRALDFGKEPLLTWLGTVPLLAGAGPLTAVREVSIAAGAVTTVAVGLLGRELGGAWSGVVAALVCAVLPFFFVHDVVGTMEPLLTACLTLAVWLQVRLARDPRWRWAVALGVTLGAALLTKGTGFIGLALLPLGALCLDWSAQGRRERLRRWASGTALAAALAALAYLVLVASPSYHRLAEVRPEAVRSLGDALAHPWRWWSASWPVFRPGLQDYVTTPVLLAAAGGLVIALLARRARLAALMGAWIAVPLVATTLVTLTAYPRYLAISIPFLAVLAGYGMVAAGRLVRAASRGRSLPTLVAGAALAAVLIPALRTDVRILRDPEGFRYPGLDYEQFVTGAYAGTGWRTIADELEERVAGRSVVAWSGVFSWALPLLVDGRDAWTPGELASAPAARGRFAFLPLGSTDVNPSLDDDQARFVVANGDPPPSEQLSSLELVVHIPRAARGATLALYRRAPQSPPTR